MCKSEEDFQGDWMGGKKVPYLSYIPNYFLSFIKIPPSIMSKIK